MFTGNSRSLPKSDNRPVFTTKRNLFSVEQKPNFSVICANSPCHDEVVSVRFVTMQTQFRSRAGPYEIYGGKGDPKRERERESETERPGGRESERDIPPNTLAFTEVIFFLLCRLIVNTLRRIASWMCFHFQVRERT
jgi:hypothetical protein